MKKLISSIITLLLLANAVLPAFAEETEIVEPISTDEAVVEEVVEEKNALYDLNGANVVNLYLKPRKSEGDSDTTFTKLSQVIDAAKKYDKSQYQVVINISSGTYAVSETIKFDKSLSGTGENPVVFRKADDGKVIFDASTKLSASPVSSDDAYYKKFPASVRKKLYKIDLSAYDATQLLDIKNPRIFDIKNCGRVFELLYDDTVLPVASYPDLGYITAPQTRGSMADQQFTVGDELKTVKSWTVDGNGFIKQIAAIGYSSSDAGFAGVTDDGYVKISSGSGNHGYDSTDFYGGMLSQFQALSRVRFCNIPEVLDQPGEYFIDTVNKAAYIYPPNKGFNSHLKAITMDMPMLTFDKAENIIFDGISFMNISNDAIVIKETSNCTFVNCTLKNVRGSGFIIDNCKNITLDSCAISDIGLKAIWLKNGGNLKRMIYTNNTIKNCDIYSLGRLNPVYGTGIHMDYEVGAVIKNNRIHDTSAQAMWLAYGVNTTLIENNEFYNAVNDTYDAGAVYIGGANTFDTYGNVVKNNYFHDIKLGQFANFGNTVALYWDDQSTGHSSIGNIFDDNDLAMLVGGGDNHTIKNNIFYNSRGSVTYDARGTGWSKVTETAGYIQKFEEIIGTDNKALIEKYPDMMRIYNFAKEGNLEKISVPDWAVITNNLMLGTPDLTLAYQVRENAKDVSNNFKTDSGYIKFENPSDYNFKYDENTNISEIPDFEYINFDNIGLKTSKQLGKVTIISPDNGESGVEGNSTVLMWKDCNGADKYRVQIAMNEQFTDLIYDEEVLGERLLHDNLKYNKTFYWRVKPVKFSKSEVDNGVWSDVYSFSTAKSEKKDTTKLAAALDGLGNGWRRVKEGERAGTYKEGSIDALAKVVEEAETIYYDNTSKMFEVKAVTSKLEKAIGEFDANYNYEVIDMANWIKDKQNWSCAYNDTVFEDPKSEVLEIGNDKTDVSYLGQQPSSSQMVKFKANFDLTNYQAIAYNMQEGTQPFWNDLCYAIVIKRDCFEIQRYSIMANGQRVGGVIDTLNNNENIITSDTWYDIETGLLSSVRGPRIVLKVDGKTVIDWVDTSEDGAISDEGYFGFEDACGQPEGLLVAGADYVVTK